MTSTRTKAGSGPLAKVDGLESLAWLMDQAIRVPGTRFRVGADASGVVRRWKWARILEEVGRRRLPC